MEKATAVPKNATNNFHSFATTLICFSLGRLKSGQLFFLDKTALGNITPVEKYMPLTKLYIKEKVTPTFQ